jgi:hypothetical protein
MLKGTENSLQGKTKQDRRLGGVNGPGERIGTQRGSEHGVPRIPGVRLRTPRHRLVVPSSEMVPCHAPFTIFGTRHDKMMTGRAKGR